MPKPTMPPTPQSTSMGALSPSNPLPQESMFQLPPPTLPPSPSATNYRPLSPTSPAPITSTRKRRASTLQSAPRVTLPPPPTRNRKIIQMKPANGAAAKSLEVLPEPPPPSKRAKKSPAGKEATKEKKKVARKTAHSLIERRRRSKMNEEFAVMKGLVPACAGVEMHKLAILQAGIDYVRYLENCVEELKKANGNEPNCKAPEPQKSNDNEEDDKPEEPDEDEIEENEEVQEGSISGAVEFRTPTFGSGSKYEGERLPSISPMLYPLPQRDHEDTEVTAGALMMLSEAENVRWSSQSYSTAPSNRPVRGMSVRDLLSS